MNPRKRKILQLYMNRRKRKVLQLYQQGERNFQGANLSGLSFEGEDLSDADFSFADIRSTNFRGANLTGTKFCGAKAGLRELWTFVIISCFLLLMKISLSFTIFTSYFISPFYVGNQHQFSYLIVLIGFIFWNATILEEFQPSIFGNFIFLIIFTGFFGIALILSSISSSVLSFFALRLRLPSLFLLRLYLLYFLYLIIAEYVIILDPKIMLLIRLILTLILLILFLVFVLLLSNSIKSILTALIAFPFAFFAVTYLLSPLPYFKETITFPIDVLQICINIYIARRAFKGDEKYALISIIANTFINIGFTIGGASFREADLTNSNFTNAILNNTNFTGANVTYASWKNTKLDNIQAEGTCLTDAKIRKLVSIGGENDNFDYFDLQKFNFQGINLTNISFIKTNLRLSNLKEATLLNAKLQETLLEQADISRANLSGAELIKAQIVGTNFSGVNLKGANLKESIAIKANFEEANLTGVCIEDWHINKETNFKNVKCDYIFLKSTWNEEEKKICF